MRNYAGFLVIGVFRVAMGHVASVQFNVDGSAVVHTMNSNVTTSDPLEVAVLREFVGDTEPGRENHGLVEEQRPAAPAPPAAPASPAPAPNPAGLAIVKEPEPFKEPEAELAKA